MGFFGVGGVGIGGSGEEKVNTPPNSTRLPPRNIFISAQYVGFKIYASLRGILGNKNSAYLWGFDLQYAGYIFVLIPGKAEILIGLEKDVDHSDIVLKAQVLPN